MIQEQFVQVPEDSALLKFFYETRMGRILLRPFLYKGISDLAGRFLDSPASRVLIAPFARKNGIDPEKYLPENQYGFSSFNAFFSRRIRPELRPVDMEPTHLISPCDGLLSVYPITDSLVLPVKHSSYRIRDLVRSRELAAEFEGGYCLVFRLCVNHYHRFCYPVTGRKSGTEKIPGLYHTVQPIALRNGPVFTENVREYTVYENEEAGRLLQMEVGAMLVGRIANHDPGPRMVERGEEKGTFLYGGSTIILLVQKDRVSLPEWFLATQKNEVEIPVQYGQWLGTFQR